LARRPERESNFIWIGEIHRESYTLLKLKSNHEIKIESIEDAKNFSITIPQDSVGDHLLTKLGFNNLEKTSGFDQCIKMVLTKRVDLLLASDYALNHTMTSPEFTSKDLQVAFEFDEHSSGLYIAMSAGSDPVIVDRLTKAFNKLYKQGLLNQLKAKWKI